MDFSSSEASRVYGEKLENKQSIGDNFARVVIEVSEENLRSIAKRQGSSLLLRNLISQNKCFGTEDKVSSLFLIKEPSLEFIANVESATGPRDFLELAHYNHIVKKNKIAEKAKKLNQSSPRYGEKFHKMVDKEYRSIEKVGYDDFLYQVRTRANSAP